VNAVPPALLPNPPAMQGSVPPVYAVLAQVNSKMPSVGVGTPGGGATPALVNPVVGPPYVPPPASPVNLDPGSGGQVPPGGRNYSQP